MQPIDAAWAAGFLDGEGSFQLTLTGDRKRTFRPIISAAQSFTRAPLDRLETTIGGKVVKATRLTVTGRPVWIWNLTSASDMRRTLPILIPHMTVKQTQAGLLLEYALLMRVRGEPGWSRPLSEEEISKRKEIYMKIKSDKQAVV